MNKHLLILGKNDHSDHTGTYKNWQVHYSNDIEKAIEVLQQQSIDLIVFEAEIEKAAAKKLRKISSILNEQTVLVAATANVSFTAQVTKAIAAYEKQHKPQYMITDDVFKNAGLNIFLQ